MKCPKCNYLSFEPEARCRNCGYDLALADVDLVVEPRADAHGPLDDFDLRSLDASPDRARTFRDGSAATPRPSDEMFDPVLDILDRGVGSTQAPAPKRPSVTPPGGFASAKGASPAPYRGSRTPQAIAKDSPKERPTGLAATSASSLDAPSRTVASQPAPGPPRHTTSTVELPLFVHGIAEREEPLVKVPAAPRVPLSVRRTTPDPARLRARMETPSPNIERGAPYRPAQSQTPVWDPDEEPGPDQLPAAWREPVMVKRVTAAIMDIVLLGGINVAMIWLALYACGLAREDVGVLPVLPLLGLFAILDVGYLILLTAACGQTLGKMATGIRVVGTSAEAIVNDRVTLAQSATRALAEIVLVLPLGLDLWWSLANRGRTLHDQIAHTRVVPL